METPDEWLELESDPGLFTLLLEDYGVKNVQVEDIYDLSKKLNETTIGFIFLFRWEEITKKNSKRGPKINASITHGDYIKSADQLQFDKNGVIDNTGGSKNSEDPNIFFASQVVSNSCATHALLSILLNQVTVDIGDMLREFQKSTTDLSPQAKGLAIGKMPPLSIAHNRHACKNKVRDKNFKFEKEENERTAKEAAKAALESLTKTDDPVKNHIESLSGLSHTASACINNPDTYHFICFLPIGGYLYELDGLQKGPINHGPLKDPLKHLDWTEQCFEILKSRMKDQDVRYNLMAVVLDKRVSLKNRLDKLNKNKQIIKKTLEKMLKLPAEKNGYEKCLLKNEKIDTVGIVKSEAITPATPMERDKNAPVTRSSLNRQLKSISKDQTVIKIEEQPTDIKRTKRESAPDQTTSVIAGATVSCSVDSPQLTGLSQTVEATAKAVNQAIIKAESLKVEPPHQTMQNVSDGNNNCKNMEPIHKNMKQIKIDGTEQDVPDSLSRPLMIETHLTSNDLVTRKRRRSGRLAQQSNNQSPISEDFPAPSTISSSTDVSKDAKPICSSNINICNSVSSNTSAKSSKYSTRSSLRKEAVNSNNLSNLPNKSNRVDPISATSEVLPESLTNVTTISSSQPSPTLQTTTPPSFTENDLRDLLGRVESQVQLCKSAFKEEVEKRHTYQVDDARRVHDYQPFIRAYLEALVSHDLWPDSMPTANECSPPSIEAPPRPRQLKNAKFTRIRGLNKRTPLVNGIDKKEPIVGVQKEEQPLIVEAVNVQDKEDVKEIQLNIEEKSNSSSVARTNIYRKNAVSLTKLSQTLRRNRRFSEHVRRCSSVKLARKKSSDDKASSLKKNKKLRCSEG